VRVERAAHLHRDPAHSLPERHICAGTGLAPAASAPRPGRPHLQGGTVLHNTGTQNKAALVSSHRYCPSFKCPAPGADLEGRAQVPVQMR
jgi:hypothetical protein